MSIESKSNVIVIDSTQQNQHKSWQNHSQEQKETFIAKLLKTLQEEAHQNQEKQLQIIKIKSREVKVTSHQINIWVDAFRMVYAIKDEIFYLPYIPSNKQLSKRFAKHFLKHMQSNPNEKRYRFLKVCIFGLRGLGLDFHASAWLNKFVRVNKESLSGLDLSKYVVSQDQHIRKKKTKQQNLKTSQIQEKNREIYQEIVPRSSKNINSHFGQQQSSIKRIDRLAQAKKQKDEVKNFKRKLIKKL